MSINVWISSVIINPENIKYLLSAIASVVIQAPKPKLVLSIYTTESLNSIDDFLSKNNIQLSYEIVIRDRPYTQFEHIEALVETQELKDNDWVMFLDDDDMLLQNAFRYMSDKVDGFVGYQFIGEGIERQEIPGQESVDIASISDLLSKYGNIMLKADDFSGTSLRFKYLKQYFNLRSQKKMNKVDKRVEDTILMNYIEQDIPNAIKITDNPDVVTPFVFHRLKKTSLWLQNWIVDIHDELNNIS